MEPTRERITNTELFISFLSTFSFIEFIFISSASASVFVRIELEHKLNKEAEREFYLSFRHEKKLLPVSLSPKKFNHEPSLCLCNFVSALGENKICKVRTLLLSFKP